MRIVLFLAIFILVGLGNAQTAATGSEKNSALTDKEIAVQWEKLMIVTSGETDEDALAHLRSHGMGEDGARALKAFRAKATAEIQKIFKQSFIDVCAKQDELRAAGPEMVAQMMEKESGRTAAARRRLLAEANSLLSPADQERLEHIYTSDHGPKIGLTESNVATRVRNGQIPVEQAIARSCDLANYKDGELHEARND